MLRSGDTVVVGFSGGADSTALLNVLWELRNLLGIRLKAVHVNHGIRKEAGQDQAFSENFCHEKGIDIETVAENVPDIARQQGLSEEEAGRNVRYSAFERAAEGSEPAKIAVAHHQDDVAETLILNLSRGTGLHGAGGIRPVRGRVIRPLLCVSRSEIESYLKEKGITYCTDASNFENDYSRNVIRNKVLPILKDKVNSRSAEHLFRAAESFAEADRYIRSVAEASFAKCAKEIPAGYSFRVEELLDLPEIIRQNVILICFEKQTPGRKDISFAHVEAVLGLLGSLEGGSSVDLPYGILAERNYKELILVKKETEECPDEEITVPVRKQTETTADIPGLGKAYFQVIPYDKGKVIPTDAYTKWFDYDRIQTAIFRKRRAGDLISIEQGGRLCKKQLGKFMTDEKIPARLRDSMYILADGGNVIWVPGYRISAAYKVNDNTKSVLTVHIQRDGGNFNG